MAGSRYDVKLIKAVYGQDPDREALYAFFLGDFALKA